MTAPLLELHELVVGYGRRGILPSISLQICDGEQWALIGPNGAGKTTLLRTVMGLLPAVSGGRTFRTGINLGYVPQRSSLTTALPARVIDIVRSGVDHGWSFLNPIYVRRQAERVQAALVDANAADLAGEQFRTLSEGQKQRVLVARALASDPQILILDEPTAAMDVAAEQAVFDLLHGLRRRRNLAVLMVSHQLIVAARHATHAIVVDKDRRLAISGTMSEVARKDATVARYGRMLIDAVAEGADE